jgi:6-phosphogluconolactonase
MAMDAGFSSVSIPKDQIHRMYGEDPIKEHAHDYNSLLRKELSQRPFDLVILGMGEDGHTASLFPQTEALKEAEQMAVANYVPQKNTWRMTITYPTINGAQQIAIYVIGASKKHTLNDVLTSELQIERFPIQKIGTQSNPSLWIVDEAASSELRK